MPCSNGAPMHAPLPPHDRCPPALNESTNRGEDREVTLPQALRQLDAVFGAEPAAPAEARRSAVQAVGRALASRSRKERGETWVAEVAAARRRLEAAGDDGGWGDAPPAVPAAGIFADGWPGLWGAMWLRPAWRCRELPEFGAVPGWLWSEYAAWLFRVPPDGAEIDPAHPAERLARLEELARWVQRNAGSQSVAAAGRACLERAPAAAALALPAAERRRERELRGRMLARLYPATRHPFQNLPAPREGRRLRVGFIGRSFGPGDPLYVALANFEHLDPRSFEVCLFPLEDSDSPEAREAAARVKLWQPLPAEPRERVAVLRSAVLDVAVFVGAVGRQPDDLTVVALHRVAPLQIVDDRTGGTTGLAEIDLAVSAAPAGSAPDTEGFTERLGLLRGPAHAFAFARTGAGPVAPASRELLGIPAEACVVFTVAGDGRVSEDNLQAWAEILAGCPEARLLVGVGPGADDAGLARLAAAIERTCARRGVGSERVMIFPGAAGAAEGLRSLLGAADLGFDAGEAGGLRWVAEALAAGVPVVAGKDATGTGAAGAPWLLRAAGLEELVAADIPAAAGTVVRVLRDEPGRARLRDRLEIALASGPAWLDSLAASDAFGALVETAHDELVSLGREEFRRQREPLLCFGLETVEDTVAAGLAALERGDVEAAAFESVLAVRSAPMHPGARQLRGRVLHAQNDLPRAIEYLVAAVQAPGADPDVWFALAQAFRDRGQVSEALQALGVCVRLDPSRPEPLFLTLELAEGAGDAGTATEVREFLRRLSPDDPRLAAVA